MENSSTIIFFKRIFYIYIAVIFLFSGFLMIPGASASKLEYIDALFLSASALSVTGLTTIEIATELTKFGQAIIAVEMQLGGIGIVAFVSYLFVMMGKKMTVTSLWLMKRDQNQSSTKRIGFLGLSILAVTLFIEAIGFLLMYPVIKKEIPDTSEAVFATLFHTISSFTNGGFSLFEQGMMTFQGANNMLIITGVLVVLGGLGYPTLMEYIFNFRKRKSLFTKINVRVHLGLLLLSSVIYLLIEYNNTLKELDLYGKIVNAFFLGTVTRSGGLNSVDTALLDSSTVLVLIALMFIGGASTSTAGGIRVTTFAVIIAKLISTIKGNVNTTIFKKTISETVVNRSFVIFTFFIVLFSISTFAISLVETHSLVNIAFEVMSALTNTGLSRGITGEIEEVSKAILMLLMVIGRVGIFSIIYLIFKIDKKQFKYAEEDLVVG